ncbi:PREDICTED: fibrillin-1-like [Priapulus caudatus]|uniref:Fibrillin-1-like n=1 Tax=Priapulus caudatus TaxID=37621 RepID=A0ABM1ENJ1_PRICU|nr:PREDICTED: fibrillin-1-like [Priapulus caudatus]
MARCVCVHGYTGLSFLCQYDLDGCADSPCFPGVVCQDVPANNTSVSSPAYICSSCPNDHRGDGQVCYAYVYKPARGGYACGCHQGFIRADDSYSCEDVDECAGSSDMCGSHGNCVNTLGSFTCQCETGYYRLHAECVDVDECSALDPCPDFSACHNLDGSYECICMRGYERNVAGACTDVDECDVWEDNRCQQLCVNTVGGFHCTCHAGFTIDPDYATVCRPTVACTEMEASACISVAACAIIEAASGRIVTCVCQSGFRLFNATECVDVNECEETSLCSIQPGAATCINKRGTYECTCKAGYQLTPGSRIRCQDVDECGAGTHTCEQDCINYRGSFMCSCHHGYSSISDTQCSDIDECGDPDLNSCHPTRATCTNTAGGYTCVCNAGYLGNGIDCGGQDACSEPDNAGCSQGCSDSLVSGRCICGTGFVLAPNAMHCLDINECGSDTMQSCYNATYCLNTHGAHVCSCPIGYYLLSDGSTCKSADSCEADHECGYTCSSVNGVETCICPRGFTPAADGAACTDVDECSASPSPCAEAQGVVCVNVPGSYRCDCINDLDVHLNAETCAEVNECAGVNNCPTHATCTDDSQGYHCDCGIGFIRDGTVCSDVDECASSELNTCHASRGVCINVVGSFQCSCYVGYTGSQCSDVNECLMQPSVCQHADTCVNTDGSFTCDCSTGYSLLANGNTCININECVIGTHTCTQLCDDWPGSYTCGCMPGYRLESNLRDCAVVVACNTSQGEQCLDDCVVIDGQATCVCTDPTTQLADDGMSCIDKNECVSPAPVCGVNAICVDKTSGFECNCLDGWELAADTVNCFDRNGGWSQWGEFGACSSTCGTGLMVRRRTCSNPTPEGWGMQCHGSEIETETCNSQQCPLSESSLEFGVTLLLFNMAIYQFTPAVDHSLRTSIADAWNEYCLRDESTYDECCSQLPGYQPYPGAAASLSISDLGHIYIDHDALQQVGDDLQVIVLAGIPRDNELCRPLAAAGRRRKREAVFDVDAVVLLRQTLLLQILSNGDIQASIVESIIATGLNTTLIMVTATAVNDNGDDQDVDSGLVPWLVAVITLASLLIVVIVVLIVVFIYVKR